MANVSIFVAFLETSGISTDLQVVRRRVIFRWTHEYTVKPHKFGLIGEEVARIGE
jgi:hypothetical protein